MVVTALAGCGSSTTTTSETTTTETNSGTETAADQTTTAETTVTEATNVEDLTGIDAIIAEAETMTLEELAAKAIEESNGKTFYGVGNSSRGKSALPVFIEYLQSIDPS